MRVGRLPRRATKWPGRDSGWPRFSKQHYAANKTYITKFWRTASLAHPDRSVDRLGASIRQRRWRFVSRDSCISSLRMATMVARIWSAYFRRLVMSILLTLVATTSSALAQTSQPLAVPNVQGQVLEGCQIRKVDGPAASIIQATGESLQRKRWQPQGGVIQFTIKGLVRIPDDASFFVCFRWRTTPKNTNSFDQTRPSRLDRNNDSTWTVTTTIPHLTNAPLR
jgi:hypothetical protein